jgi:hypothetical protein
MFRQRNLEKLPIALDYDDDRIRRFTGSCQFESDPLGLLKGRGGIRKFLTEVVLEYRRSAPEMKIVARHGFPGPSRTFDEPRAIATKYKQHKRPRIAQGNADWRKGSVYASGTVLRKLQ